MAERSHAADHEKFGEKKTMGTRSEGTAPSFTEAQFHSLANEMRAIASRASSDRDREGLLLAADNYERLAATLGLLEKSRAR